jgi:AcrR family transcriptional regulator
MTAASRLRTPGAILQTAASVLAERPNASMNDIAVAVGIGQAAALVGSMFLDGVRRGRGT